MEEASESNWSIWEYEKVKAGDRFFMLKVGCGTTGIVAAGVLTSEPSPGRDWSGRGRKVFYSNYHCEFMVNSETLPIIGSSMLEDDIPGFDWFGGHSGVVLDERQAQVLLRIYENYLYENAHLFADRLGLLERRGFSNDQLYIDRELLERIQAR